MRPRGEFERRGVARLGLERGRQIDLRGAVVVRGVSLARAFEPFLRGIAAAGEEQSANEQRSERDEPVHASGNATNG